MLSVVCLAAGCTPIYDVHGFVPFESDLENIEIGQTTKVELENTVGYPAFEDTNYGNDWYFVASRFQRGGISAPKVIDREVVVISFDEQERVSNIGRFSLADGRVVELSRRVTEQKLGRLTILDQLSRAFGRINVEDILDR